MASFMERFRAGEIPDDQVEDELDDAVDVWHNAKCNGCAAGWSNHPKGHGPDVAQCPVHGDIVHLHDHLGMTWDEFRRWVSSAKTIFDMRSTL